MLNLTDYEKCGFVSWNTAVKTLQKEQRYFH